MVRTVAFAALTEPVSGALLAAQQGWAGYRSDALGLLVGLAFVRRLYR